MICRLLVVQAYTDEIMHSVHRSKTRGSKCFCCAATSLPLGADWPQRPLTPMPVPPLLAVKR